MTATDRSPHRSAPASLTWLGQASFRLELAGLTIAIDPFVSHHPGRRYPPPPRDLVDGADWILVTHEHGDHLDPPLLASLLESAPGARLIIPAPLAEQVPDWDAAGRLVPVAPGDRVALASDVSVLVVPAVHGVDVASGYNDGSHVDGRPRFVGFLVAAAGHCSVYHSGDTLVTDGLIETLRGERVDVALLPVNGCHYFRERVGTVGNMGPLDAVELARELDVRMLVPMHWDFARNDQPPGAVVDWAVAREASYHVTVAARNVPIALPTAV